MVRKTGDMLRATAPPHYNWRVILCSCCIDEGWYFHQSLGPNAQHAETRASRLRLRRESWDMYQASMQENKFGNCYDMPSSQPGQVVNPLNGENEPRPMSSSEETQSPLGAYFANPGDCCGQMGVVLSEPFKCELFISHEECVQRENDMKPDIQPSQCLRPLASVNTNIRTIKQPAKRFLCSEFRSIGQATTCTAVSTGKPHKFCRHLQDGATQQ